MGYFSSVSPSETFCSSCRAIFVHDDDLSACVLYGDPMVYLDDEREEHSTEEVKSSMHVPIVRRSRQETDVYLGEKKQGNRCWSFETLC